MTTLLSTAFTGTNGAAWPAPWTTVSGTTTIQTNRGQTATPASAWSGGEARANLTVPTGRVDATVRFSAVPGVSARINVRWNPANGNGYRLIMPTDYPGFQLVKVTEYAESPLAEQFISAWAANTDYRVAIEWTGKLIRAKRWLASDDEPAAWDLVAADATYTTGDVALVAVNNADGLAASVLWDDVTVVDVATGIPAGRIGYHDDAFQGSYADLGTFTTFSPLSESATRAYLLADTGVPVGGESAEVNSPDTLGPAALAELAAMHFDILSPAYHPDVLASWTSGEKATVDRSLGYRLRLTSATLPNVATAAAPMAVSLTMTNEGWSAMHRNRPVRLVLVNGGTVVTRDLTFDLRTLGPGQTATITQSVTAPAAGTWAVHLLLPAPDVANEAVAAYAVRLAQTTGWDGTTGRNALGHSVTVS